MIDASIGSSVRLNVDRIGSIDAADAQLQLLHVVRERDEQQTSINCNIMRHNFKFSQLVDRRILGIFLGHKQRISKEFDAVGGKSGLIGVLCGTRLAYRLLRREPRVTRIVLAMGEVVQAIRVIIFFLPVRSAPNQFFTQSTHSERLTSFPQLRMCIVSLVSPLLGRSQLLR